MVSKLVRVYLADHIKSSSEKCSFNLVGGVGVSDRSERSESRIQGLSYLVAFLMSAFGILLCVNQLFHLNIAGFMPIGNAYYYYILTFYLSSSFLIFPSSKKYNNKVPWFDWVLFIITLVTSFFISRWRWVFFLKNIFPQKYEKMIINIGKHELRLSPAIFYEKRRRTWRSLWNEYFWHGKGAANLYRKNKRTLLYSPKVFPLASIINIFLKTLKAYKMLVRKEVLLLPFHYAFKRLAWSIGFIKGRLGKGNQS